MMGYIWWSWIVACQADKDTAAARSDQPTHTVQINSIELEFMAIPAGTFRRTIDPLNSDTQQDIQLTQRFYMMQTETTQKAFYEVMGYNPLGSDDDIQDNFPASAVTWHVAASFANALSEQQDKEKCYRCDGQSECSQRLDDIYQCHGYRLPTEAEWEYAARSGSIHDFWTSSGGGDVDDLHAGSAGCESDWLLSDGSSLLDFAWFCGNRIDSAGNDGHKEVSSKQPNAFALYDMAGNVAEWTNDWYQSNYDSSTTNNPNGPNQGTSKVVRGGDWSSSPHYLKADARNHFVLQSNDNKVGFRLVYSTP